jgi:diguanylate cyclase (GGDEF)-like protein
MVGCAVSDFLADPNDLDAIASVFRTRDGLRSDEVWFRRADGSAECLSVVAVPIFDQAGNWQGCRGLCRTVTEQQQRELETTDSRLRARMTAHFAHTMQNEINPEQAVAEAIPAVGLAASATGAVVFRRDEDRGLIEIARWGDLPAGGIGASLLAPLAADTVSDLVENGWHFIGVPTHFQTRSNGGIVVCRETDRGLFTLEERGIIGQAAGPFGAAIAQLASYQATLRQSRTDALTGLPNRRAFRDEAARRLARAERAATTACVLFADCDNFKLVNDVRGHREGDNALIDICRLLQDSSRPCDTVARLGGDEFVMWLDGMDDERATQRAQSILDASRRLAHYSGDPERPFGVSLGLAIFDPARRETLDQLLARADAAMYEAKRGRKGYAVAARAETAPS